MCQLMKARRQDVIDSESPRTTSDAVDDFRVPLRLETTFLLGTLIIGTALTVWAIYAYTGFTDPLLSPVGGIALLIALMFGMGLTNVADEALELLAVIGK
ncbi:MAG: hypothetical protein V5A16_04035 [Haloplanus sp.]